MNDGLAPKRLQWYPRAEVGAVAPSDALQMAASKRGISKSRGGLIDLLGSRFS
jgi:hypothetical protein